MDDRQELLDLRRLAELESRSGDTPAQADTPEPSALAVAGNAAYKGLAGAGDFILNIAGAAGNTLIPPPLRPGAMQDPLKTGMESVGLIREENEPQTPGQRILDLAVQAGVNTALAPSNSLVQTGFNAIKGVVSGGLAGLTKEATGSDLAATGVAIATPLLLHAGVGSTANTPTLKNPVKTATLRDAQKAGYVVPPSQVKPSFTTNKLEGIAGKAAVRQEAAIRNQEVTNTLAAKAIGLPEGTPITKQAIEQVRAVASQPYQEVEALRANQTNLPWFPRYHSTSLIEELKQARADATQTFTQYNRTADPAILAKAKQFRAEAESIEKDIAMIAKASGQPDLVKRLSAARQLYARTYDVERATNFADGNVNAQVLGTMAKKGKPLSGELAVIGRFAQAFPSVTRPGASVPAPGVSGTDAAASAMLGTIGYGAAGGPAGLMAGGLPLIRGGARPVVLSKMYQKRLLREPPELNQAVLQSILAGRAVAEAER
mgnify:CR=1 FL=1